MDKPDTERQILHILLCVESKITKLIETESRMVATRGWRKGTEFRLCKMRPGDAVLHSNTALCI